MYSDTVISLRISDTLSELCYHEERNTQLTEMFALIRAAREDSLTALMYSPEGGRGTEDMFSEMPCSN